MNDSERWAGFSRTPLPPDPEDPPVWFTVIAILSVLALLWFLVRRT